MAEQTNLEILNERITPLKQMLDDPHPGLFAWKDIVEDHMIKLYTELHTYEWLRDSVK